MNTEWVRDQFPGDGLEIPDDMERARADETVARFNKQWGESRPPIPRTHPDVTAEGYANPMAGQPTNRAYLRTQLRRWWARKS
jgi:hypothetical protein